MKRGLQYLTLAVLLSVIHSGVIIAGAPIRDLGALQNGVSIKVSWQSESENGLAYYEVLRSSDPSGPFVALPNIKITPVGDHQFYSINDNCELFKTVGRFFYYKVRAVFADGSIQESDPVSTYYNSTSSAAKRTWGSIKAMFR